MNREIRYLTRLHRLPRFLLRLVRLRAVREFFTLLNADYVNPDNHADLLATANSLLAKAQRVQDSFLRCQALEHRAEVLMRSGRYGDAIRDYGEAIRMSEDRGIDNISLSGHIVECLGACHCMTENYSEAEACFRKALPLRGRSKELPQKIEMCQIEGKGQQNDGQISSESALSDELSS